MAVAGLYRRALPSPPAIEFASPSGKQLFKEALDSGNMQGFFKLISYYQTQSEPAYCGLASLSMVLNALAIDPGRKWKGPWRWFDDSMLDCCEPLAKVKEEGISFGKLACLAHCNGAQVEAFRTSESTIDDFRRYTGTGHFSPIGGYHAERDMVLILDVARFKYPPHWVPLLLLWKAMDTVDDSTGYQRGSCRDENWNRFVKFLTEDVPPLMKSEDLKDVQEVLFEVFTSLPSNFNDFIKWIVEVRRPEDESTILSEEEKIRLDLKEEILKQVQTTELFTRVTLWLSTEGSCCEDFISWSSKNTLPEIAAQVCCQGADLFSGRVGSQYASFCKEANVKLVEANGQKSAKVVCGTVMTSGVEQRVEMLVPSSQRDTGSFCGIHLSNCNCLEICGMHPSTADVLTVLLLALPQQTWSGIRKADLKEEMCALVVVENLPPLLQDEILHLRRQLHFLMTDQ